ncbi:MAG: hypothetical protein RRZ84_06880 [Romboutsia sp.]
MIGAKKIIEKKKEYLFPSSHGNHFYKNPPQIVKGDMQHLYDREGNEYIDFFAGVSVMNCGHCNKKNSRSYNISNAKTSTYNNNLFNRRNGKSS